MSLAEPAMLLASGLVFHGGRVARFDDGGAFPWVLLLRKEGALEVPRSQDAKLLQALLGLPVLARLDLPEELRVEELAPAPHPCLRVSAPKPSDFGAVRPRAQDPRSHRARA